MSVINEIIEASVEKDIPRRNLNIAIDSRNLTRPVSGISRMISGVIEGFAGLGINVDMFLPSLLHSDFDALSSCQNVRVHESNFEMVYGRLVWSKAVLSRRLQVSRPDVFWAPAHRLSYEVSRAIPSVLTIHDMVWKFAPETMPFYRRVGDQILTARALDNATRIIAVSNRTAEDLIAEFPRVGENKIRVVPNIVPKRTYPAPENRLLELGIRTPYVLFVGTVEPRKNLVRCIEAFLRVPKKIRRDICFVIAGGHGWLTDGIDRVVRDAGHDVLAVGKVDEVTLSRLYKSCQFLVMPSIYEGFGYPVIEVQQYGKRVLTSVNSSMAEIGGETVVLVDPLDVKSIYHGFIRCFIEDNNVFVEGAIKNAARFQPDIILPQLLAVFNEASDARTK